MLLGRGSLVAGLGQRSGSPLRARGACRATAALRLPWQRPRPRQQAAAVPQLPAPLPVPTPTSEQDIAAEFWAAADKLRRDVTDDATRAQKLAELNVRAWFEEGALRAAEARSAAERGAAEAARQAEAAAASAEASLFGEPFPWSEGFTAWVLWWLQHFGLSEAGATRRAARTDVKPEIWWNEDGTVDT